MSDDKKKPSNGNGNGNGSGHRVIQFAEPPPPASQQPQQQQPPPLVGGASVIAKLKGLLAAAEAGHFNYMVFVGIAPDGNITVSWSTTTQNKDKIYLLGAIDLAKTTMLKDLSQTAKKGTG